MSNMVDTVEDSIQNAILTAIDNIVAPKIELPIRSINASSGRDVASVTANSERWEHVGISASFENASENNNVLHVSNVNDETRHGVPDEVSELSVPRTRFDRQAHTHHRCRPVEKPGNIFLNPIRTKRLKIFIPKIILNIILQMLLRPLNCDWWGLWSWRTIRDLRWHT